MKNRTSLLALMQRATGRTTIRAPIISESLPTLVGYFPSWAPKVKRIR